MQTSDFSQLSKDEVAKHIEDFIIKGNTTLKEYIEKSDYWNYDKMFELYRIGLEKLSKDALINLRNGYRANNASAMINGKLADVTTDKKDKTKMQIEKQRINQSQIDAHADNQDDSNTLKNARIAIENDQEEKLNVK